LWPPWGNHPPAGGLPLRRAAATRFFHTCTRCGSGDRPPSFGPTAEARERTSPTPARFCGGAVGARMVAHSERIVRSHLVTACSQLVEESHTGQVPAWGRCAGITVENSKTMSLAGIEAFSRDGGLCEPRMKAPEKAKLRRLHFRCPRHLGMAYDAVGHGRVVAGRKLPLINLLEPAFDSKQKEVRERARPGRVCKGHPRYLTGCLLTVGWRCDSLRELTYDQRLKRPLPGDSKPARRLQKMGTKCKKDTI
jgi:hypothetical protein